MFSAKPTTPGLLRAILVQSADGVHLELDERKNILVLTKWGAPLIQANYRFDSAINIAKLSDFSPIPGSGLEKIDTIKQRIRLLANLVYSNLSSSKLESFRLLCFVREDFECKGAFDGYASQPATETGILQFEYQKQDAILTRTEPTTENTATMLPETPQARPATAKTSSLSTLEEYQRTLSSLSTSTDVAFTATAITSPEAEQPPKPTQESAANASKISIKSLFKLFGKSAERDKEPPPKKRDNHQPSSLRHDPWDDHPHWTPSLSMPFGGWN